MPKPRLGRPLSRDWLETTAAADALGISSKFLTGTLRAQLKPGHHYRCKNPQASDRGKRYLWHLPRLEAHLSALD
jgi:hypothetical protein